MENAVVLFLSVVRSTQLILGGYYAPHSAESWFLDSSYQQSFLFTNLWSCHLFERYKYSIVKYDTIDIQDTELV